METGKGGIVVGMEWEFHTHYGRQFSLFWWAGSVTVQEQILRTFSLGNWSGPDQPTLVS